MVNLMEIKLTYPLSPVLSCSVVAVTAVDKGGQPLLLLWGKWQQGKDGKIKIFENRIFNISTKLTYTQLLGSLSRVVPWISYS